MERLSLQEVSMYRISDGCLLEGPKPTVEIGFHAAILRARLDVNVVMHFQTPAVTTLACCETGDVNYFVIPEIPFYIGHVAKVPFLLPGSNKLAEAVSIAAKDHDIVVMTNHGAVAVADNYDHVIQNAEFFELACKIIINGGDAIKPLHTSDVECLLAMP